MLENAEVVHNVSHGDVRYIKAKHFDKETWFFYWENDELREIVRVDADKVPEMTKDLAKVIVDAFFKGRQEGIHHGEHRAQQRMRQALGIRDQP